MEGHHNRNFMLTFGFYSSSGWPVCTTLYRATDLKDTAPITYLICDVTEGVSRRIVFEATTYPLSTAVSTSPTPFQTSNPIAPSTSSPLFTASTSASISSPQPSQQSCPTDKTAKNIGLGAGIGIGFAALLLLAFFMWRKVRNCRRERSRSTHDEDPSPMVVLQTFDINPTVREGSRAEIPHQLHEETGFRPATLDLTPHLPPPCNPVTEDSRA